MKQRRWFLRWARRVALIALGLGLALAGAWWWFRPTLAQVAIVVAHRALPGIALEAASVRRVAADHLEVVGLRICRRADAVEVLTLGEVHVLASWRELRARHIREIRLVRPRLEVTPALLEAFKAGQPAAQTTPWTIGRVRLEGGEVAVRIPQAPPMEVAVEAQLTEVRLGGGPGGGDALQQMQLRDLRLQTLDGATFLRVPSIAAGFTWRELRENHCLASVRITAPEGRYDLAVKQMLESGVLAPPGSGEAGVPPSTGRTPWRIGRLQVAGGRLRLEDGGAGVPDLAFGLEADLRELVLADAPVGEDLEMQSVTIRGLEARAPGGEGEPFLRVPVLQARFRWRELLADHWINAVELDRPAVRWEASVQRALVSSQAAAPVATAAVEPYHIGVLQIRRATVQATGLGPGLPAVAFGGDAALTEVPLGASAGEWPDAEQAVSIRDLTLQIPGVPGPPFLRVPAIYGTFNWRGLMAEKRIGAVRIEQPELRYEPAVGRALAGGPAAPKSAPTTPERAWRVDQLAVFEGKVHLTDLGLGMPPIDFGLNTAFQNLALSLEGDAARTELQTIELHHLGLQSPVDPFTSVLNLPTLFIRFTPAGLWRRQIEQVEIIHPMLNVGEDLFWYIDRVQARDEGSAPADPPPPDDSRGWTINRFDVTSGQLVLAFQGHPKLPLPLPFETHARSLNFANLSELRLTLDLVVPEQDYLYPDYDLTLRRVSGHLQFSLPPEKRANNLVHTLQVAEVRWKDFRTRDLFLDVTFDEKAIHGELGGKAYAGYVRGAFDFGLDAGAAWNGWVSGTRVDLKGLTDAFAPERLSLSGPADFAASVVARAKEIDRFEGDFKGRGAGEMHIGKLDEIIRELPPEWTAVKRSLTRIGLETVRDFTYDTAHGDFRFLGRTGRATLELRGPRGSRQFEALVHDGDARSGGRSFDDAGAAVPEPQPRRRGSSALQSPQAAQVTRR